MGKADKSLLIVGLWLIGLMLCSPAFSADTPVQQISVRTGEHAGYSRLVFDWEKSAAYKIQRRSPEQAIVTFDQNARINLKSANVSNLSFVDKFRELSRVPLQVALFLDPDSEIKDFKLGTRVVIDVLKPVRKISKSVPSSQPDEKTEKIPVKKIKDPVITITQATPPSQDLLKALAPEKDARIPTSEEVSDPPDQTIKQEEKAQPPLASAEIQEEKPKTKPDIDTGNRPVFLDKTTREPNLISLSTIMPTNMAAFQLYNQVWLINDNDKALISPQLNGPQADDIAPLSIKNIKQGKVFTFNALRGGRYWAQGGGLVWRFLIGHNFEITNAPIEPIRKTFGRVSQVVWPFKDTGEIIDVQDPVSGTMLKIVTVANSASYAGRSYDFVDFKTLPSPLGLAIWPKVDDLIVEKQEDGSVAIYRKEGVMALTSQEDALLAIMSKQQKERLEEVKQNGKTAPQKTQRAVYDFKNWRLGGIRNLEENKKVILGTLPGLSMQGQVENLLTLARMYISNGMGAEAIGFLEMIDNLVPDLKQSPEYKAIEAIAFAQNGRYKESFERLSDRNLQDKQDVRYWRSYVLAYLKDWQQAAKILPADIWPIQEYPAEISIPLSLTLTEVALRGGDKQRADDLFSIATLYRDEMRLPYKAAYQYLQGESARQEGNIDKAIRIWKDLSKSEDDLYRVKATLALTRLEREEKDLPVSKAIDRLERIRYAWRGDDLEAQVNYWLGRIYFDGDDFVKGLNIMRDAASFANGPHLGQRITEDMTDEFSRLFLTDALNGISGPDAAALYERFAELVPSGEKGDQVAKKLANRLVAASLYEQAIDILSYQLKNRLQGKEAYHTAVRLAAIYLLNSQAEEAIKTLKKATKIRKETPNLLGDDSGNHELALLSARALSENQQPAEALALLGSLKTLSTANELRAEIAWRYQYWDDAAEALQYVIENKNIDLSEPLSQENTNLIMQRAVALNLAGDRIRLANMRETYSDAIYKTPRAKAFEVVTRARQNAELADRETLMSIASEVELFSDFLNSYKQEKQGEEPEIVPETSEETQAE